MKRKIEFYEVRGKADVDFHVRADDDDAPTTVDMARLVKDGTVLLGGAKITTFTPPHPAYADLGAGTNLHRMNLTFDSFGIDGGDLMTEVEAALRGPALIHDCVDFEAPETCYACSLLHRVRNVRKQKVTVP